MNASPTALVNASTQMQQSQVAQTAQVLILKKAMDNKGHRRADAVSLYDKKFVTRQQAVNAVMDWMAFYNHRRLHSTLAYLSPMQYEERWHAAQRKKVA